MTAALASPRESSRGAAARARFARSLVGLTGKRQALCRVGRIAASVLVVEAMNRTTGDTRIALRGVLTCGSGHSCPMCCATIATVRGEELQAALAAHGRDRTLLVTLTMRHHVGMMLQPLRRVLGEANSELWSGRAGMALRAQIGLIGSVRANEQTHGRNGWHPHQHQAWFLKAAQTPEQIELWKYLLIERWQHCVALAFRRFDRSIARAKTCEDNLANRKRFQKLWGTAYAGSTTGRRAYEREANRRTLAECAEVFERDFRTLGGAVRCMPDDVHGVDVSAFAHSKTYLTKMGLEVSGIGNKAAKDGHETHWEVYRRAGGGDRRARRLVREHYAAMRGSSLLQWSPGLRRRLGLVEERPDADIVQDEIAPTEDFRLLRQIDGAEWDKSTAGQGQLWLAGMLDEHADGFLHQDAAAHALQNLAWEAAPTRAPPVKPLYWENWGKPKRCPRVPVAVTERINWA